MSKSITIKDLEKSNVLDEISEYLFGIDDILERMILQFIFKSKNYNASMVELREYFVYKLGTCSERRLYSRLKSLTDFKFIYKTEINEHTFYFINDDWLQSLKTKDKEY